ncbi:MAG: FAD-dependent oxidoreductase, partial [Gammaproteobacteria bacterium]
MNNQTIDIVILGGGPAGVVTALGLNKLGYEVLVVSSPRPYRACEGLSERALVGLRNAGCLRAAATLPAATPRYVCWNGVANSANQERLALRETLDMALLQDLEHADIKLVQGRVSRLMQGEHDRVSVTLIEDGGKRVELSARFAIDARGRNAPGGGSDRTRGPETVSLLQHWQGPPVAAQSMAVSFSEGWAWLARTADGQRFTQVTVAADAPDFPKKSALHDYFQKHL